MIRYKITIPSQVRFGFFERVIVVFILISVASCGILSPPVLDTKPVSLYNPGSTNLHPEYGVYHSGNNESTLYFRVLCKELLFNNANPENETRARIRLDYILYSSFIEQNVESSGTQEFTVNRDKAGEVFSSSLKLLADNGKSYFLEVALTDLNRDKTETSYVFVDRYSDQSQQNYLVLTYPGNDIAFEKFFYPDEMFRIISNKYDSGIVRVSHFNPVKVLPPPPFHTTDIVPNIMAPDSSWEAAYDQQTLFQMGEKGIYQFFFGDDRLNGLYLTNFGDHFPQITTPEDMAPPLQYITTSEEYQNIIRQKDLKKAIDNFWLALGKDYSSARDLIKIFYTRVLFANLYYSTDREGWKTDRGMIYIMMGPPGMVKKTETREEWHYQTQDSRRHYRFEFTMESHPIKVYDFSLFRTEDHRMVWEAAVRTWRDGRIFSL